MSQRIDHVNIRIPEGDVERAVAFYDGLLGFEPLKLDAYRAGERTSFFFRVGETSVLTIRPVETFEPPSGENLDHFCIVLEETVEELKPRLEERGVEIVREGTPFGATGRAPSVYVRDPFGYLVELKQSQER